MSINEIPIWARVLCYVLLITFAITIVFPFMWMVFTSFKSMEDYTNNPFGVPTKFVFQNIIEAWTCLLYTSPSPRDGLLSRMPSSA